MAFSQLVQAEMQNVNDHYSESMRWQAGYSDCSSFVGKALKSLGIVPPGSSVTTDYLLSSSWTLINRSELQAGDICVNAAHMVTATDNLNAIGQQNPTRNVAQGPVDDMMAGTGSFVCKRYKGSGESSDGMQDAGLTSSNAGLSDAFSFPEGIINFFNEITAAQFWLRTVMILGGSFMLMLSLKRIGGI